jgi:hypothetical protein
VAYPMPLVVPKSRTAMGLGGTQRIPVSLEISKQTKADLHSMLVGITREETAQQIKLGNPPQVVEVDNRTNKPVDQVDKKVVVLFGTQLAAAAMRMIEIELRQAIGRSTTPRSGKLGNVGVTWHWRYIPKGGSARIVSAASPPKSFQRGDQLSLVPLQVPYATSVNRRVANAGRLNSYTATGKGRGKNKGNPAKSSQHLGFLAATTRALRKRNEFKQFSVRAEFTLLYAVPGEVMKARGTGVITIMPRGRPVKV